YATGECGTRSDWNFEPGSDRSSENPVFNFKNPGEYIIQLTIEASCGTYRAADTVSVYAPPTATILEIEDLCGPGSIIPKANVQACGSSAPEYIWTFEDGIPATSSELEPGEIEFSGTGEKTVSLEVISSCGNVLITETFMVNEIPELDAG